MAMACFIKDRGNYIGKSVVIICCGGNIGEETLATAAQILC